MVLGMLAIFLCLPAARAQFSLPLYERFAYTNGEPLGASLGSAVNWQWGNSASGSSSHPSTNAALTYIGMPVDTTAVPNGTTPGGLLANTGTGKVRGANFSNPMTNVTIYASFMLNIRSLAVASTDRLLFSLGSAITGSTADGSAAVWLDPSGRLKVSKNSTTVDATNTTYALVSSNTYLVVFRYQVNTSTPDQVDLWLNPTSLGNNSSIPTPDITTTNNANARTFNSMTFNGNAPTHVFFMDEIRVSTNWADVTPITPWTGNTFNVTGGGSGCGGDSFIIGLTGSDAGIGYLLYTNGVPTGVIAVGTGSAINFGLQSGSGTYTVLATNTTDTSVHWMTGSAVVSVLIPPTITAQPASVLAATNSSVVFMVTSAGSGLSYQWYRNGVGLATTTNISGATTPILTIAPATAAEIATTTTGYYCIITNACGSTATTITNALTLHPAANIVWQGSATTNVWDLANTADFTNASGASVVFNPGDNVRLDDSFLTPLISLASPYLSPGLVSFVGTQNMSISGNGNINNNGNVFGLNSSLLVNGTGSLTISNGNTYAGGTTISNGYLVVDTFNGALGSGPVTLAGGILRLGVSGASVANMITNNFIVTATSTVQYDGTGGNAFNFGGTLTGTAGQTLSFSNNTIAATLNWVRLTKGFTNNANILLTSPGAAVEFAPVLNGGDQVYNGTISGIVGRVRPGGGNGSAIFNAQNTYNDSGDFAPSGISLYMTGGNAGFGADSTASSPPTIDASPAGTGDIGIDVGSDGGNCGFFASGGAHTVGNPIIYTSATNTFTVSLIGNNNLTFSGSINLSGFDGTGNTNRTFAVTNNALATFSGVVSDSGLACGLIKSGAGTLDLNAANTYTGSTIVSNGILAGVGSLVSPVTVAATGNIGAGTASVGTLTINNSLTLNGGGFFKLNKSGSPASDLVSVSGALASSGSGTITVTNIGVPALVVGDTFHLFNKAVANGSTLSVVGGSMTWTNRLAVDGTIQALASIANYSTNISVTVTGSTLSIQWPATHLGWILQDQTNALSVGLASTNAWFDVLGTASVTSTNFTVNPANPTVFYRLRHP